MIIHVIDSKGKMGLVNSRNVAYVSVEPIGDNFTLRFLIKDEEFYYYSSFDTAEEAVRFAKNKILKED